MLKDDNTAQQVSRETSSGLVLDDKLFDTKGTLRCGRYTYLGTTCVADPELFGKDPDPFSV